MPKDIVIGSNSFSGQDFVDLLLNEEEHEVIGVSRSAEAPELFLRYREKLRLEKFRFRQFDLNKDMDSFLDFLDKEKPSRIINFAAQGEVSRSWDFPEHWFQTNCVALSRIIRHICNREYVQRYLHISTPEVYGSCEGIVKEDAPLRPSSPYAASKASADMLVTAFAEHQGLPLLTVRATNVYGARQQLYRIIMRTVIFIRLGKSIPLHGGGNAVKSYIHIRDVSRGEKAVLDKGKIGRTYHLSPDGSISIRDLVSKIAEHLGKSLSDVTCDVEERLGQDRAYVIDSSRARFELEWKPEISLDRGISEVIDWINHYWDIVKNLPHDYIHKI